MRLIDADNLELRMELFTYTRETGIDELPFESADMVLNNVPTINIDDLLAKELEQIKAEIIEYHQIDCNLNCDNCKYFDCIEAEDAVADIKIIDKHISKLKGETE